MMSGGHLDETRLSAVLDGEADAADTEHLSTCDQCASTLADWQGVSRLLGGAPTAPPGAQDAAVTNAVAELDREPARRHRVAVWAAAAAFVLVAAGSLTAGLESLGSSPKQAASSVASGSRVTSVPPTSSASQKGSVANGSAGLPAAQLGSVPSTAALVARLHTALHGGQASAFSPDQSSPQAVAAPSSRSAVAFPCAPRVGIGDAATPVYEAQLTFEGRPAVVFVFRRTEGDHVVVVAADGCSILAEMTM